MFYITIKFLPFSVENTDIPLLLLKLYTSNNAPAQKKKKSTENAGTKMCKSDGLTDR